MAQALYTNRVLSLRKARRISQAKMADDLQICRRSVGQIERGEQNVTLDMAYRIAAYFDMMVSDVFPPNTDDILVAPEGSDDYGL